MEIKTKNFICHDCLSEYNIDRNESMEELSVGIIGTRTCDKCGIPKEQKELRILRSDVLENIINSFNDSDVIK